MNEFFSNNLGTILAGIVVLIIVGLIVGNMTRKKKRGEKIIDCGGECSTCGGSCGSPSTSKKVKGKEGMVRTTLGIDGMMCGMCESHMNDCIRNNFKVKTVVSSHKKGETVVVSKSPLDEENVKRVVEATGYKVISFSSEVL